MDYRKKLARKIKSVKSFVFSNAFLGPFTLGLLAGLILGKTLWDVTRPPKVLPRASSVVRSTTVEAKELYWNDAIRQVFPADEAGRMIRICMAENKRQNEFAINWNTNGTYDYSWCQVNSVHKPKGMSDEGWKSNLRNPIFHAKEVRRIFLSQWWGAWTVVKWIK